MYKVLSDTSNNCLILFLFKNDDLLYSVVHKDIIKQVEKLPLEFEKLLKENNIKVSDIKEYYLTLGPGSFTGSRVAISYFKPMALLNDAKIFTCNSIQFIVGPKYTGDFLINARSNKAYFQSFKNGKPVEDIKLIDSTNYSTWDIDSFEKDPLSYLSLFKETPIKNVLPIYVKDVQIGGN